MTGNDGVVDRVRSNIVGATAFLTKPITAEQAAMVLQQHLGQSLLSQQAPAA